MGKYRYILTHEGTELVMSQPSSPQGWDSLKLSLKRDPKLHGVFFEFSDTELTFFGESKELIVNALNAEGVNGKVNLQIEYSPYDNGEFTEIISGLLNFSEYTINDNSISINVEQEDRQTIFKNRVESEFNLISDRSIGGVDLTAINAGMEWNLNLTSRRLKQLIIIEPEAKKYSSPLSAQFLPIDQIIVDEIKGDNTLIENGFSFITIDDEVRTGLYSIEVDVSWVANLLGSSANGIALFLNNGAYETVLSTSDTLTGSKVYTTTVNLQVGDKFGIGVFLEGAGNEITLTSCKITYKVQTQFPVKEVEAITLGEAFRNASQRLIDNEAIFKSDLLGFPDGVRDDDGYYPDEFYEGDADPTLIKFYKFLVLNGFYVRGFPSTKEKTPINEDAKPFNVRFDKLFESANSIIPIGAGFDSDSSFRVDSRDYFYNAEDIFDLGEVNTLSISPDLDNTKSNIKVGYKKYENNEDSENALLGIHGQAEWNTPIDRYDGKFNAVSEFIADMYSIELTRRQEYDSQTKKGWKYDKDIFIIHAFRINAIDWRNISDEQLESSTDLEDPETVYNLAVSTQRNARRHQKWYSAALRPFYDNEVCNFLSGEPNTLPAYELDDTAPVLVESSEIQENADIDINAVESVFNGRLYSIEKVIELTEWISLKSASRSKVQFSYNSVLYYGYLSEVNYEPEKSLLSIEFIGAN